MGGVEFWLNHPDFQLVQPEDPDTWCPKSVRFVAAANTIIEVLGQEPASWQLTQAKGVILDAYNRYYYRAPADHRAETNLDNHKCLHQALLAVSETLENMEFLAAVRELQPPPSRVLPSPAHPVIDAEVVPEPPVAEVSGIDLGEEEEEADTSAAGPA